MTSASVLDVLTTESLLGQEVELTGWVRTVRSQKDVTFIKLYDTSTIRELQIIAEPDIVPKTAYVHATIHVRGIVVESPGTKQSVEVKSTHISMIGDTKFHDPSKYSLAKTKLTLPYLRQYPHLRIRTKTMQAVMRISGVLSSATHDFFKKKRMSQVMTPIMTGSDCEGAGEVFHVATDYEGKDKEDPFFSSGKKFLTVSGQLELEMYACGGVGSAYTFGPCFRAEKSSTSRHLAEFWMVEAELIKTDLTRLMDFAEEYVRFCVSAVLGECKEELEVLDSYSSPGLIDRLKLVDQPFARVSYLESIDRLQVPFGTDLTSDQEKELLGQLSSPPRPTFVMCYPQKIKAFYMKPSPDATQTVQSFDLLVPGIGELIGGSMREEEYDAIETVMKSRGMKTEDFEQYLDLRKFGSIPHGGFGLGFGRLVMLCTGIESIRDVTPFPVHYKS
jgi:asparaginyl-tRNA synthetase